MFQIYKLLTTLLILFTTTICLSQNFWSSTTVEPTEDLLSRNSMPLSYKIMDLDVQGLKQAVQQAPERFSNVTSPIIITMPDATGYLRDFTIYEAPMMETELYNAYPHIRTYVGVAVNDTAHIIRFSITYQGLHSIEFKAGNSTLYTDPFTLDGVSYIIYNRDKIPSMATGFICETLEPELVNLKHTTTLNYAKAANDGILRRYRIAISTNAEYGNFFAGSTGTDADKLARIQAQQVITMNRVNGIFERDLSITFQFVANNDILIYFGDTTADPYTNDFNTRTQNLIDGNLAGLGFPGIGNAAYDIGHNFNTSGGGNAGCIGCVCTAGSKGSGMTGRPNPTGDPFDVDYVAHEIGHQFGGFHTMASDNCRSGNGQTEAEPGSGSTIMAYAGICAPNIQGNSDDYFHYVSIRDITANVKTGISSACSTQISLNVTPPQVNAGNDYTIPFSTAFVLEGSATNVTNSTTYLWEQFDTENPNTSATPLPTQQTGPLYRSFPPVTTTTRYFPRLSEVVSGNLTPSFEVTPSIGRTMKFAFTARSFTTQGGQNNSDDIVVTVAGNKGPFTITSLSSPSTLNTGESINLTWNVAGTDQSPINTQNVDILLSVDGGLTFDTIIASATPNDGSHVITIPVVNPTNSARIMIKAVGNIYYAVNAAPITITQQNFSLTTPALNVVGCQPNSAGFNFTYRAFAGFNEPVTLSTFGLPAGVNAVFTPQTVTSTDTAVTVIFTGINTVNSGNYAFNLIATAASVTKTIPLQLDLFSASIATPGLQSPVNNAIDQVLTPLLSWARDVNATSYVVQVALDANFANIVTQATVTLNEFMPSLVQDTDYYWRVQSINDCVTGSFSAGNKFTTAVISCLTIAAVNVPVAISSGAPAVVTSSLNVSDDIDMSTVTVDVNISHTYLEDLIVSLISPQGTVITLVDSSCGNRNDMVVTFDDQGNSPFCATTSPTLSGLVIPKDALAVLAGESSSGNWSLQVEDTASFDGGAINSWALNVCGVDKTLSVSTAVMDQFRLYPNPVQDKVTLDLGNYTFAKAQYQLYDLSGKIIANGTIQNKREQLVLNEILQGIYILRVQVDGASFTQKLIKE